MTDEEKIIGKINAILYASEDTIASAKPKGLLDTVLRTKEWAYDLIVGVINDPSYCPWQE